MAYMFWKIMMNKILDLSDLDIHELCTNVIKG